MKMKIESGEPILVVLQNPREKIWGILREINQAGVFLRGIDLNSFEDFVLAIRDESPFYGYNEQFIPMWRVEKLTLDTPDGDIPSLNEQFEQRTGTKLPNVL